MNKAARPVKLRDKWRIRWVDHTGKRCSAVFDSYVEAERELRARQVEVDEVRAKRRPPPPPEHAFSELATYWRLHRLPGKRSGKEDDRLLKTTLEPHFGKMHLKDITTPAIDAFTALNSAKAPRTVRNYLALLSVMLGGAVELGWLTMRPTIRAPRINPDTDVRQPWLTKPQISKMLEAAKTEQPVVHVLYSAAVYTGMRAGELAGLRWPDVDLVNRTINVRCSFDGPTKTLSSRRFVPIVDALLPTLRDWKERCPKTELDLVFPSDRNTMLDSTSRIFREQLYRVLDRAGFERPTQGRATHIIHFHSLRHSFAVNWRLAGGSIDDLIPILGHTSRTMTMYYASLGNYSKPEHFKLFGEAAE
jgi:integrase